MRASCAEDGQALSPALLDNIVYFGTDTHFHVKLDDGADLHRAPAERPRRRRFADWATASASFGDDAAQVLRTDMATPREHRHARTSRRDIRNRWLLSAPALVIIAFRGHRPAVRRALYSFLLKGPTATSCWSVSLDGWFSVFLRARHLRRHAGLADAHLRSSGAR
jgi:hypothetical protein